MKFTKLKYDPVKFLLSPRQPAWVKYQTYIRILKKPLDDSDVEHWRKKRDSSAIVHNIRLKQGNSGWFPAIPWMHIHKYYFHRLIEMGYGLEDATVRRAADNLLNYQLPNGGYMHPTGSRVNIPNPREGWAACVTGYVTKALIDLGLIEHPNVKKTLHVLLNGQNPDGGWICQRGGPCVDESNCIISGSPWVFACLAQARLIDLNSTITKKAIKMFSKFKKEIMQHGYMQDRYYRCDESLLIPSLCGLGISKNNSFLKDLLDSLLKKQQPDGSWYFRGKSSSWYTIEAMTALQIAKYI